MTRNHKLPDLPGLFEELQSESARAAVVIAGAFLDAQLRELLATFMIDDNKIVDDLLGNERKVDRPLSSFSSRINAAYCLGLISPMMHSDLHAIRKMRNRFAHKLHGYTFDEPEIISWCASLKLAEPLLAHFPKAPKDHRTMFLLGVTQLANWLALQTLGANRKRRTTPADPKVVERA